MTKQKIAEQPKPRAQIVAPQSDIYRIRVNRGPLPTFAELETEYGKGHVSVLFDGRKWTKSAKRTKHDVTTEEVDVLVKDFGPEIASGEIKLDEKGYLASKDLIAWGLRNNWVPADEKEAYEVGRDPQTRDLPLKGGLGGLVALGSSARYGRHRYVMVLLVHDRGRFLHGDWVDNGWCADDRFPFVRKSA